MPTRAMVYGACVLHRLHGSILSHIDNIQRNSGYYICSQLGGRSCWKVVTVDSQPPSGYHSGFSVCIYFHKFFHVLDMTTRQQRFKNRVFLSLHGLASWAVKHHLHKTIIFLSIPHKYLTILHFDHVERRGKGIQIFKSFYFYPHPKIMTSIYIHDCYCKILLKLLNLNI